MAEECQFGGRGAEEREQASGAREWRDGRGERR